MTSTDHRDELAVEAPGADEVQVVPWPLLLRQRVTERVESSPRYRHLVLATCLFGLFSVGFTITILATSIPRIAGELHSSESTVTWVVTAPLLMFAVFGPAAGKLGDLRGHRKVYISSLAGVSVFALLTALAPNVWILIVCRGLGAAIGAAEGPSSLAIINRLYPADRRAQALGWWSMVGAGAPVVGVVLGGPAVEAFGWRWIFVAQVPLTLCTVLLASAVLPETDRTSAAAFDLAGAVTLGLGTLSLLVVINQGPEAGWSSPIVATGVVVTVVSYALFAFVERRAIEPLLPLHYLRRRNFAFPMLTQFFGNFAYMGGFILTPLFLQDEFGYGESHAGLLNISRPLTFAIVGPIAGYLALRVGERTVAVIGALSLFASMLALAHISPGVSDVAIVGALALSGLGMGAMAPSMVAAVANSVDDEDLGIAGATTQMISQVGVVLGMQVLQAVHVAREATVGGVDAFHEAYLVGGFAALLAAVAAAFVSGRRATGSLPAGSSTPATRRASTATVH